MTRPPAKRDSGRGRGDVSVYRDVLLLIARLPHRGRDVLSVDHLIDHMSNSILRKIDRVVPFVHLKRQYGQHRPGDNILNSHQ